MNDDHYLIAYENLEEEFPESEKYLFHYFKGKKEKQFVIYHHYFKDFYAKSSLVKFRENFTDHSGYTICRKWSEILTKKIEILKDLMSEAKKNNDMVKIVEIATGNYGGPLPNANGTNQ